MYYPIRRLRRRQNREYAIIHLRQIHSKRRAKSQTTLPFAKSAPKHVSFSGQLKVCPFSASEPPILSILNRPSHIENASKETILALAKEMKIPYKGVKMGDMKKQIASKWILGLRECLGRHQIDHSFIEDREIEDFYNVYLSFKRSASVFMSGEALTPLTMELSALHAYMANHRLSIPTNASRDLCIRSVETYLLDHIRPVESPIGDLSRKRFSAVDYFNNVYYHYSASMLNNVLRHHQMKDIKNAELRKKAVVDIIEKKLSAEYLESLQHVLHLYMEYHSIPFSSSQGVSSLLYSVYQEKKRRGVILEETDGDWVVCLGYFIFLNGTRCCCEIVTD